MKASLTILFFVAVAVILAIPSQSFAQAPDTVVIPANPISGPYFNEVIMGDTTATGQRNNPNRVYVLQQTGSTDTVYFYNATMITNFNVNIVGKINPTTGMPPVVAPYINPDNSVPSQFIRAGGGKITLKYLYLIATRIDSIYVGGFTVYTNGDSVTVNLDHCVLEQVDKPIEWHGNGNKLFVTNCEFRNMNNQFWQGNQVMWAIGGVTVDTVIFDNNTFFLLSRSIIGSPKGIGYFRLNHNTIYLTASGLLLATQLTNAEITNNIFYGISAHAIDSLNASKGGANNAHEGFGVIMLDTLTSLLNPPYNFKESDRNVIVKNNVYFWPKAITDVWKAYNDTASVKIIPSLWMNPQTALMFNDKTKWPGLTAANNDSTDPGFDPVLTGPAVDSLAKFIKLIGWVSLKNSGNFRWWQKRNNTPFDVVTQVPKNWKDWIGYPVPENLAYSNTTLQSAGTDGKPLGDLNWFPKYLAVDETPDLIPTRFELSQNYPNPFNPTTQINYSVPQSSFITLKVYNVLGQEVATLYSGVQTAGKHVATFDASKYSSGVYFYRLQSGNFMSVKKMVLLK